MEHKLEKAEKFLFLLLLFSIPFQRRVFLWSAGVVEGFNEWQSVFLYGTDLLIISLFALWGLRQARRDDSTLALRPTALLIAVLLLIAAVSIFTANYTEIAVYRFIKLCEFAGLFFYTASIMRRIKFTHAALAFAGGAVFQSAIAITQFFRQGSVGLGILGEAPISAGRSDVAEFVSYGSRFMRAYGTFPSPNVLAAFLALALLFVVTWHLLQKRAGLKEKALSWGAISLISFAMLLTFSRAQIAALALAFIFYLAAFAKKDMASYRRRLFMVLIPLAVGVIAMAVIFWPEIYSRIFTTFQPQDRALSERVFYTELSYQIISDSPGGVGMGNYTLFLRDKFTGLRDSLYQPVHNIYLLSVAELGIVGGLVFIIFCGYLLLKSLRQLHKKPSPRALFFASAFIFILTSSFFDHFFWTLQQGSLVFWITGGMLYSELITQDKTLKDDK